MRIESRDLGLRFVAFLAWIALGGHAAAQEPDDPPQARPAPTDTTPDLDIPDGAKPSPPREPLALWKGDVVRVLSEVGSSRLVKLPTGALTVVPRSQTTPTDKPFRSASIKQMVEALREDGFHDDFKTARAGYYLFAYQSSEAYYQHTRSILTSMLKGVVGQLREWGLEPKRPETPLVVLIFPNRKAFDAYQEMPAGVAAYYNGVSNYVVLYEDDRLFDAAPEFALKQGSYVVAHEAIHQLLHNTGIQQRLSAWSPWISEGVPEYFCPLRVHSSLAKLDGDQLPVRTVKWSEAGYVNDLRMHDLLRTKPESGRLIREVTSAGGLTAHGYSVAWGVTHYLAERRPKEFAAYLADVKKLAPLVERNHRGPDPLFVKHFGEDFGNLELRIQRHLTSKPIQKEYRDPYTNQTHYIVSVTYKKARTFYTRAGIALSPTAAREWTDKQRRDLDARGLSGHIVTRECKDAREARYQLRKILN